MHPDPDPELCPGRPAPEAPAGSANPACDDCDREVARRKAVTALWESEERFRVTFEQAAVGIAHVAPDGRWLRVNRRMCEILGYEREELLSRTFQDLTHPEDLQPDLTRVQQTLRGEISRYSLEKRYLRRDGSVIWGNLTVSLIRDDGGAPKFFISVVEDISRAKAAEAEVCAQRDRAQTYLDLAGVMMVAVSPDQTLSLINKKGCELLGGSEADLVGRNWFEHFIPERHRDAMKRAFVDLLAGRTELSSYYENPIRTLAGDERLIAWNNVALRNGAGEVVGTLSSGEDITERRRAEEALYRAHAELEERVRQRTAELEATNRELEAENARRLAVQQQLQREMRHVALLQKAAVAANEAATMDEAFRACLEEVCALTGWAAGHARLYHSDPEESISYWHPSALAPGELAECGAGLRQVVLRAERAVWIEDLQRLPECSADTGKAGWRGAVALPLRIRGRVVGVLAFFAREPLGEDPGLLRVMEHVAVQLGRVVERAQTERRLSQQGHLLELAHDTIIIRDLENRIRFWNHGAEETYGWTREEALGQVTHTLLRTQFSEPLEALNETLFLKGRWEGELIHTRKNGELLVVESRQVLQRDAGGRPSAILEINRDVTARKQAEQALEERARELARSNADLEQFANVASHDLQEPLRMVASYTQLLAKRYQGQLDERADRWIGFAVDGAHRMQTLINDLLAYSRVGTRGEVLSPVEAGTALAGALANLRLAIRDAGAEVIHGSLPVVLGDQTQLVQLFQNLIGNAVKFRGEAPPRVEIAARQEGGEWVFSVRDNGIGIAPEFAERIFVIFQRLHERERYPGTGIGLAICKRIVERHGGRIWLDSQEGPGSTFLFTLKAVGEGVTRDSGSAGTTPGSG